MRIFIAAVLIVVSTSVSLAERRVALVFGADRYDTIRPLRNAVNDARSMEDALGALGFEVFIETNRDLRRMRRALEDFEQDAKGADVAFVFFSGHGVEIDGENMLLPTDASVTSVEMLKASSLPLNELRDRIARVARSSLIVLDACRNDPFATQSDPQGRGAFALRLPKTIKPGLGRVGGAENTLFAFSAAPGETADDGLGRNSPFTAALTKYLATDGLEIRSVLTLVQQEVYDRSRGMQLPYVESGLPSLFFASQTTGMLPERERLLLAMADISPQMRADVERIAIEADMPLAPLFGALIGSDATRLNREERGQRLRDAAQAFTRVRNELRSLRSGDERVTALRQEAEEQLSLGAFETARAKLTEAANIDASSRETLKANFVERTLSEAATHYLNGGAAAAELRHDLAIEDYEKAVELFGDVPGDLTAEAQDQQLQALQALGRTYVKIGNLPGASTSYQSQIESARRAVNREPDNADWSFQLSLAQDNLGDVLFEQGDLIGAVALFEQSLSIRENLVRKELDDPTYLNAVSNSHERLGDIQFRQGDLDAAEQNYLAKHRIGTRLVARGLSGFRWPRDLSISDERLGDISRQRGDLAGALSRYRASLDRMIPVRDANPGELELRRFTSITLDRMGDVFTAQGELTVAKRMYEESLSLRLELLDQDPANTDWQYVTGISHERIGDILLQVGDLPGAIESYRAKHDIVSALAEADPTNVRWQRDLSVSDERLGDTHRRLGQLDRATEFYRSSLDRMTPIRDASATDLELKRFTSITHDRLGDVAMQQNDPKTAEYHYAASLRLRELLISSDPGNTDWQYILGISYERMGNVLERTGQLDKARDAYQRKIGIVSRLSESDPTNIGWLRDLSVGNELLADVLTAQGDVDGALENYMASLSRMSKVRDASPENLSWQRFTAVTSRKMGAAYIKAGRMMLARQAFADSTTVSRRLIAVNADNARWQRDLLLSLKGLADAGADPLTNYREALEFAESMIARGTLAAREQHIPGELRERLQALEDAEAAQ